MAEKHDVFISYANADKTTADTICHFLEAEGVRCWIAPRDIPPGENFGKFIPEALREVALMVLVFSSNANSSEYVQDEVALAAKYKRVIIPFRVEDVQPQQGLEFHLARRNWLDALTPPLAGHVRSLVGRVLEVLGHARPEPGESPRDAESRLKSEEERFRRIQEEQERLRSECEAAADLARRRREEEEEKLRRLRQEEKKARKAAAPSRLGSGRAFVVAALLLLVSGVLLYRALDSYGVIPRARVREVAPAPRATAPNPPRVFPLAATQAETVSSAPRAETDSPAPQAGETRSFAGMEFCWCPPGKFMMGSALASAEVARRYGGDKTNYEDTTPVREVVFSRGFWMGKYEVTNEAFEAFVKATGHKTDAETGGSGWGFNKSTGKWEEIKGLTWRAPGCWTPQPKEPVVLVSWNDAQAYVHWLNRQPGGGGFCLPGEAQWEYACRADTATEFFWGDDAGGGKGYLNAAGLEGAPQGGAWSEHFDFDDGYPAVAPVGSFKPNSWGLYDMHGNVYEWCQDWYHGTYDGAPTDGRAWESPAGEYRVLRGGSWNAPPGGCRAAYRGDSDPGYRSGCRGFRLLRTP